MEAFVQVAQRTATDAAGWEPELVHTPHRDYAWRVHAPPRVVWANYLVAKASDLSYGNFKEHCADRWTSEDRDSTFERLEMLHDAWMLFNHWPSGDFFISGQIRKPAGQPIVASGLTRRGSAVQVRPRPPEKPQFRSRVREWRGSPLGPRRWSGD